MPSNTITYIMLTIILPFKKEEVKEDDIDKGKHGKITHYLKE